MIFKSQCIGDPISKLRHREVTVKLVKDLEKKKLEIKAQGEKIMEDIAISSSSSS